MRLAPSLVAAAVALTAAACTTSDQTPAADSTAAAAATAATSEPAVRIVSPANGDTVTQPFTVRLEATGVEVIPANGTSEPGKGHHHLLIDGEAPTDSMPLPPAPVVIHMGNGATERVIDSLSVGPHRIIAIFAGGDHVPWTTVKRDTITVIVK